MKTFFYLLLCYSLCVCCSSDVDKTSIDEVRELALAMVFKGDTSQLTELYDTTKQKTLVMLDLETILSLGQDTSDYNRERAVESRLGGYLPARDRLMLDYEVSSKASLSDLDYKIVSTSESETSAISFFSSIIKVDTSYWKLNVSYTRSSSRVIQIKRVRLSNLNKECHMQRTYPSKINGLKFQSLAWETDVSRKEFTRGQLTVVNHTDQDLTGITFLLQIRVGGNEVFYQTIKRDLQLPQGEQRVVDISELERIIAGSAISQNTVWWYAYQVDAQPHKFLHSCKELEAAIAADKSN